MLLAVFLLPKQFFDHPYFLFQFHFKVNKRPPTADLTAQLVDGTEVLFNADGSTKESYPLGTSIQNIVMNMTDYVDGTLPDQTIENEDKGRSNEETLILVLKQVDQI